jgi:hypothetical protein
MEHTGAFGTYNVMGLSIRSQVWKVCGTYRCVLHIQVRLAHTRCVWHIQCDGLIDKISSLWNIQVRSAHRRCVWHIQLGPINQEAS